MLTVDGLQVQEVGSRVLFQIGGNDVTVAMAVTSGVILFVSLVIARIIGRVLDRLISRRTQGVGRGSLRSTIRLVQYGIALIGLLLALQALGIRLAALFAAGALFAVALGFAMQNMTANFISGVILLFERSIKPGDIIEVGGQVVQIKEMGIRAAIGRTLDEEDLIIPSSTLVQATVRNYTLRDPMNRLRAMVGVTYDSDMHVVRNTLKRVVDELTWRSPKHDPVVYMKAFGNSSVDFEVSVWFEDPWRRQARNSDLHEAIWWALKDAGVTIAFPQVDVHLDPRALAALSGHASREEAAT